MRLVAPLLLLAAAGCGEEASSPTAPERPAAAVASASVTFIQVAAGLSHTCGLTTDGLAYCWGSNGLGQLGDGTNNNDRLSPVAVKGGLHFVQISAGAWHTCAITQANVAYCWGWNIFGQLGDGTTGDGTTTPKAIGGGRRFRQIRAGYWHTCAINLNDAAYCWGQNEFGQLGTGSDQKVIPNPTLVRGGLHFRQVVSGATHTCAVTTDDRGYCWGDDTWGQLGDEKQNGIKNRPVAVAGGLSFQHVSPGSGTPMVDEFGPFVDDAYTCGITTDNKAYCWGRGVANATDPPTNVSSGRRFTFIAPSELYACGASLSNAVFCWGSGTSDRTTLSRLSTSVQFKSVSAFAVGHHFCGLNTENRAYCWGKNDDGQLGDGTTTDRSAPVPVGGGT